MTTAYTLVPDLGHMLPQTPPDSIISRTFYQDDQVRVILFAFAPGQELSEHTSSKPAILHFLSGEARLWLGGEEMSARRDTWVHMPAQLKHRILAQSEVTMLLYLFEAGDDE